MFMLIKIIYQYTKKYIGQYLILSHLMAALSAGILTLAVSLLSWYFLEQPFLKLKTYFSSQQEDNLSVFKSNYSGCDKQVETRTGIGFQVIVPAKKSD